MSEMNSNGQGFLVGMFKAIRAFRGRYVENRRNDRRNSTLIREALLKKKLNLEFGATEPRSGWYTVDILPGADFTFDLTKKFPFPDGSVDRIYCSHVFEHFTYRDLHPIISECHRVLKKGGTLSVCVPDAEIYLRGYTDPNFDYDRYIGAAFADYRTESKIDVVNFVAYLYGNHKHLFDQQSLLNNLRRGGFQNVARREFDPTLDRPDRDYQSIYAVATK